MNSESKGTNMFHGPSVVRLIPAKLIYTYSVASWFLPHQLCNIYHIWDKGHLQAEEIRCRLMEDFLQILFSLLYESFLNALVCLHIKNNYLSFCAYQKPKYKCKSWCDLVSDSLLIKMLIVV